MTPSVLLTDTHPLVFFFTGQFHRLPKKVKQVFESAVEGRSVIFVPAIVLWELSFLLKAGSVKLSVSLDELVREHFFANAISIQDLETEDILKSHTLTFSRDPFDVLIVAMALRLDCPLITGDGIIHAQQPCELFWD
jgi:PIN domain nuclease of toxin-antitoxin system